MWTHGLVVPWISFSNSMTTSMRHCSHGCPEWRANSTLACRSCAWERSHSGQIRAHYYSGYVLESDTPWFLECARHIEAAAGVAPSQVQYVVVTETPSVAAQVTQLAEGRSVLWWNETQKDEQVSLKTIVDHQLLSYCNDSILTFASTYGFTGVYFRPGQRPHHLFGHHYQRQWEGLVCERRECNGEEDLCWINDFGYWDTCDEEIFPLTKGGYLHPDLTASMGPMSYPNSLPIDGIDDL
mmetsp:Transcript_54301/g.128245  ORF Transcript_54301/g.128245 Transcript_54301/m.128245 type:complete len:240 (-) Transcript_54301:493-1212(-)